VLTGLNKRIVAELPCIALTGNEVLTETKTLFDQ
jgi:hypothetical protein